MENIIPKEDFFLRQVTKVFGLDEGVYSYRLRALHVLELRTLTASGALQTINCVDGGLRF